MSIPGNWALNRSIQNTDALYAFKGGEFGKAVGIRCLASQCVFSLLLAVRRTLVAILEDCLDESGAVRIPIALRPYMGGVESITP